MRVMKRIGWAVLLLVMFYFIAVVIAKRSYWPSLFWQSYLSWLPAVDAPTEFQNYFMHRSQYSNALKYIEPRLLSPSTAKFIPKREAQFGKSSQRNSIVMVGWVDAQNNFGAMIRLHFNAVFDSKEPTKLIAVDWAEGARWSVD